MVKEKELIKFEEKNPDLQMKFLRSIGLEESSVIIQAHKLESQEYWDFIKEKFNNQNG